MNGEDENDEDYGEAATQLVDLDEFRKYMEEEEKEKVEPKAVAPVISPPQMAPAPTEPKPSLGDQEGMAPDFGESKGLNCAVLGVLSLIPVVGLFLGPVAIMTSLKEQKAIEAKQAPSDGMTQVQIGLYGGAVGVAISVVAIAFKFVN